MLCFFIGAARAKAYPLREFLTRLPALSFRKTFLHGETRALFELAHSSLRGPGLLHLLPRLGFADALFRRFLAIAIFQQQRFKLVMWAAKGTPFDRHRAPVERNGRFPSSMSGSNDVLLCNHKRLDPAGDADGLDQIGDPFLTVDLDLTRMGRQKARVDPLHGGGKICVSLSLGWSLMWATRVVNHMSPFRTIRQRRT